MVEARYFRLRSQHQRTLEDPKEEIAMKDPFYIVQEEVEGTFKKLNHAFAEWDAKSDQDPSKATSAQGVYKLMDSVAWQVKELEKAVRVSERNPSRFGLNKDEIDRRRRWTSTTLQELQQIRDHLAQAESKATYPFANPVSPNLVSPSAQSDDVDGASQDRQALLIRRQDEDLDMLSQSVTRLGQVGLEIGEELDQQGRILSEFEGDIDGFTTRLAGVRRNLAHLAKKSGMKGQICVIILLVAVLILLITVVFS